MSTGQESHAIAGLESVRALYFHGLYLQAYEAGKALGPFVDWPGTSGRLLAGRLVVNLGNASLGRWLIHQAYRAAPEDPEARYYFAHGLLERRGPLAVLAFDRRVGLSAAATAEQRTDWHGLLALCFALLRDFSSAHARLEEAEHHAPREPYLHVQRATVLRYEDRYPESLASAERSLELQPWFRPGVVATAEALELLGERSRARDLLVAAAAVTESMSVVGQLVDIEEERVALADARRWLERLAVLSPLATPDFRQHLDRRRARLTYLCGDTEEAARLSLRAGSDIDRRIAQRMAEGGAPRRVTLAVEFVRQHQRTCVPATLAALSRFFEVSAEHLEIAEEICYDGTPMHSERRWAEGNGFVAREFALTWDTACALIDRGIPFVLTTHFLRFAHAQAIVGYDARLQTLLLRDSTIPYLLEADVEQLLANQRSTGPRCLAIVPAARASLLDGLQLPDAYLFDLAHELDVALASHRREDAVRVLTALVRSRRIIG